MTTQDLQELADLARGLTKGQRANLELASDGLSQSGGSIRVWRPLIDADLVVRKNWRIMGRTKLTHSAEYVATPLGLSLQAYLKEKQG